MVGRGNENWNGGTELYETKTQRKYVCCCVKVSAFDGKVSNNLSLSSLLYYVMFFFSKTSFVLCPLQTELKFSEMWQVHSTREK